MHSAFSIFLIWEVGFFLIIIINLFSLFFSCLYKLPLTPVLYLSNPIMVNIVTAQSSILQKHLEPEPMAYLLGAYWFVKVQSDPVKCLARRQGIDLLRGSGFGKLLGGTGDRGPLSLVPPKGWCCQDTLGAQGNPRNKNGGNL